MFFKVEKQLTQYNKIVLFLDNDLSRSNCPSIEGIKYKMA